MADPKPPIPDSLKLPLGLVFLLLVMVSAGVIEMVWK